MKTQAPTLKAVRKFKTNERQPVTKRVLKNTRQDEDTNGELREWKRGY